jgi:NMD protein affecting ribosome stability and mRNA decay
MANKRAPQNITVEQCRLCGRIRIKGMYRIMDNSSMTEAVEAEMRMPGWKAEVLGIKDREVAVRFYYNAERDIAFEKSVHMMVVHRTCTDCFKRSAGYYEAVVQLRGNPDRVEKLEAKIREYLETKGAFVSKTDKQEAGLDVYVSSKALISEFFTHRKLKPKKSFTLYGMRNGKSLYRNTYFLRM